MPPAKQIMVSIPQEMAAQVSARVASGEYASESEVIRDGLRALQARDRAIEGWVRGELLPAYDDYRAAPANVAAIPLPQLQTDLHAHHGRLVSVS